MWGFYLSYAGDGSEFFLYPPTPFFFLMPEIFLSSVLRTVISRMPENFFSVPSGHLFIGPLMCLLKKRVGCIYY